MALAWTALAEDDLSMQAALGVARAQNWAQFEAALRFLHAPQQTITYADVEGNIAFGMRYRRDLTGGQRAERIQHYLRLIGLEDFARSFPNRISGGMRQRVAIARSLAAGSDVLLMDEPFGALDALTRERLQVELRQIQAAEAKTIIFVTHDVEEAVFLADRIELTPGRVLDDTGRQVGEVALLDLDEAQALGRVLVQQGLHDRALARATRAGEQHVIGGLAVHELARVLLHLGDLRRDALQVRELHAVHVAHRLQPALAAGCTAPAEGDARLPVGGRRGWRQDLLQTLENFLQFLAQDRYSALIFT